MSSWNSKLDDVYVLYNYCKIKALIEDESLSTFFAQLKNLKYQIWIVLGLFSCFIVSSFKNTKSSKYYISYKALVKS